MPQKIVQRPPPARNNGTLAGSKKAVSEQTDNILLLFSFFTESLRLIVLVFQGRHRVILTRKQITVHTQMMR